MQRIARWAAGTRRRPRRRSNAALALLLLAAAGGCSRGQPERAALAGTLASVDYGLAPTARVHWLASTDSLDQALATLEVAVRRLDGSGAAQEHASAAFGIARAHWKAIEFIAEYYEPSTSRSLNGPAIPEVEEEEGPTVVRPPEGFQVVEQALFPAALPARRDSLAAEVATMREHVTRLRRALAAQRLTDSRVFEAAKYEIARLAVLGVTGYDSPVAQRSLPETAAALDGMRAAFSAYLAAVDARRPGLGARLDRAFGNASGVVGDPAARFDDFDRLAFIARHLHPLAHVLDSARATLALEIPTRGTPFRAEAASVFDPDAFDAHGFAAIHTPRPTAAQVALGEQLFADPRLSGSGTRACQSCHDPARAFVDGRPKSAALGGGTVRRNTPTIVNAGLQVGAFADLRTTYLEDQVNDVVGNASEMHGSLEATARRLERDSAFMAAFRSAYPGDSVSPAPLQHALASYLRSRNALDSRLDRALRQADTLTALERRGFNVFAGKGKCATCHFLPLTNGTVPPTFQRTDVEVIGVPAEKRWHGARIDPDSGRAAVTHAPLHRYAFKTPTLRNVALTAPYMHNGVYATLEEVVDFYNRGGGAGIGITLDHQTLPPEPLRLTAPEQRALVAFLRTLTDTTTVRR